MGDAGAVEEVGEQGAPLADVEREQQRVGQGLGRMGESGHRAHACPQRDARDGLRPYAQDLDDLARGERRALFGGTVPEGGGGGEAVLARERAPEVGDGGLEGHGPQSTGRALLA